MHKTYDAVLRGDKLEWKTGKPTLNTESGIDVQITIAEPLSAKEDYERGEEIYALLEKLASQSNTPWPEDPVAWQREIRKDRPLFGREED